METASTKVSRPERFAPSTRRRPVQSADEAAQSLTKLRADASADSLRAALSSGWLLGITGAAGVAVLAVLGMSGRAQLRSGRINSLVAAGDAAANACAPLRAGLGRVSAGGSYSFHFDGRSVAGSYALDVPARPGLKAIARLSGVRRVGLAAEVMAAMVGRQSGPGAAEWDLTGAYVEVDAAALAAAKRVGESGDPPAGAQMVEGSWVFTVKG